MKIKFLVIAAVLVNKGFSQINFVPNASFEIKTDCPFEVDQIEFATGWFKTCGTDTTPDYYNTCYTLEMGLGIPFNFTGYQTEYRGCDAYAGVVTSSQDYPNYRESIGIELTDSLVVGSRYYVSFYVVLYDLIFESSYFGMASNNLGMLFSTNPYSETNPVPVNNFAQFNWSQVVEDTLDWKLISGSFIADSSYKFISIGNHFDDANTDTLNYDCVGCLNKWAYYRIDDVCVSQDSALCHGGLHNLPCDVGLTKINKTPDEIFPNPFTDQLFYKKNNSNKTNLQVYSMLGQLIFEEDFYYDGTFYIDLQNIESGFYLIKTCTDVGETQSFILSKY